MRLRVVWALLAFFIAVSFTLGYVVGDANAVRKCIEYKKK
jgi:hypothetical protein